MKYTISGIKKIFFWLAVFVAAGTCSQAQPAIDRSGLVHRHNVINTKADSLSSVSVGNGSFAFTADITGMQSFPGYYKNGVPLGTQSEWGWHSFPNKDHLQVDQAYKVYELEGKKISYAVQVKEPAQSKEAADYFRVNQHRLQLGNIGLELTKKDGTPAAIEDIRDIRQQLDLWTGTITSAFTLEDIPVKVTTLCHQQQDAVAFNIESALLAEKRLQVRVRYPYPNGQFKDVGDNWGEEDKQQVVFTPGLQGGRFKIVMDTTVYYTALQWSAAASLQKKSAGYFLLSPGSGGHVFAFSCRFSQQQQAKAPSFIATQENSTAQWKKFWLSGGAVDFSGSTDTRAFEIERRTVLSQYLTKIQCASAFPTPGDRLNL